MGFREFLDDDDTSDYYSERRELMPNRMVCSVLEEMRKCCETSNYSYLPGLIEEAQTLVNRMEAALYDQHDLRYAKKELDKLRKEIKELKKKKRELKEGTDDDQGS